MKEIQDIKNEKILALDLDDCIIPWMDFKNYKNYQNEYIISETEKNIKYIKEFCKKNNFKIVLTSSWARELNENFELKKQQEKIYETLWNIIFSNIKDYLISKDPFNDRILCIDVLLDNNYVLAIDDLDLSHYFSSFSNFDMINVVNGNKLQEKLKEIESKLKEKK